MYRTSTISTRAFDRHQPSREVAECLSTRTRGVKAIDGAGKGKSYFTCTWFETMAPGPSSVHISSVLIVSKLHSPMAEMWPSSRKSRRWFNATKYPLSE